MSTVLRILTCSELFLHAEFYANHPYIKSKSEFFDSSNAAFTMALCGKSAPVFGEKDRANSIEEEALHMSRNGVWSSLMCILGLSSVLRQRISSYYPTSTKPEVDKLMNGDVEPREGSNFECVLHLLWTGTYRKEKDFTPNHFLPLNSEGSVGSSSFFQSKIDFSHAKVVSKGPEVSSVHPSA